MEELDNTFRREPIDDECPARKAHSKTFEEKKDDYKCRGWCIHYQDCLYGAW